MFLLLYSTFPCVYPNACVGGHTLHSAVVCYHFRRYREIQRCHGHDLINSHAHIFSFSRHIYNKPLGPQSVFGPWIDLPQTNRTVLTPTGCNFTVWRVADTMDRAMVPFAEVDHIGIFVIIHTDPLVRAASGNKAISFGRMQVNRRWGDIQSMFLYDLATGLKQGPT